GVAGAILLGAWLVQDRAIRGWMTESSRAGPLLTWAIGLSIIASSAVGFAFNSLPDPTQIGPNDIEAVASRTCSRLDLGAGQSIPVPTVTLDVVYRRADLLPGGGLGSEVNLGDPIGVSDNAGAVVLDGGTVARDTVAGTEQSGSRVIGEMNPNVPDGTVGT